jgi:hypothetical protein
LNALLKWDYDDYKPLQARDPELYRLICAQIGFELDILIAEGSVKLGLGERRIVGDDEDLLDVVLEGAKLLSDQPSSRTPLTSSGRGPAFSRRRLSTRSSRQSASPAQLELTEQQLRYSDQTLMTSRPRTGTSDWKS